ncbi:ATP-binding protein [Aliarcobacter cryaerophilus]|uniref:ATP-binding protein n=1 Tax=Aliarcobacter cryaerophilus TaxID=28198 RepID=UPI003DA41834
MGFNKAFEDRKFMIFYVRKLSKVNIIYEIDKDLKLYSYEHIISNTFLVLFNNSLEASDTFNDENYIKISANIIDNKTIITYEDNAGGIKIKPIELVFDYFVTSKNNNKSSGIGLAVAKLLIEERLNGKISVTNNDAGAVFTITL